MHMTAKAFKKTTRLPRPANSLRRRGIFGLRLTCEANTGTRHGPASSALTLAEVQPPRTDPLQKVDDARHFAFRTHMVSGVQG